MRARTGCGLVLLSFLVLVTSIGRSTWCVPPPPSRKGVLGLAVGWWGPLGSHFKSHAGLAKSSPSLGAG